MKTARFLGSPGRSLTPPKKKLVARPAGPREPRRGSRDGLELATTLLLGGYYGVDDPRTLPDPPPQPPREPKIASKRPPRAANLRTFRPFPVLKPSTF